MPEQQIYLRFIDWLKQTWWGLPEADELMPLIMASYTPEEASLLTGMPFSGKNLECIGCGVCAYKCSTQSLVLERREAIKNPPKDGREYIRLVTADFDAARAQAGQRSD
ncbi:hypothetical protein ACFLVW_06845, partial [Chloroflexota bacterium]